MENLEKKLRGMEDRMKWILKRGQKEKNTVLFEELMMRGFQKSPR